MSVELGPIEHRAYEIAEEAGYWVVIRRRSRHSLNRMHVPDPTLSSYGDPENPVPMCGRVSFGAAENEEAISKPFLAIPRGHYKVCGHCTNRLKKQARSDDE